MKGTMTVIGLIALMIFTTGGCKLQQGGFQSPKRTEAPEYDCRKSAERICKVPWKDKIVLYCYMNPIPRVVRYKEECV